MSYTELLKLGASVQMTGVSLEAQCREMKRKKNPTTLQ